MRTPNLEDLISLKNEAVKFMKYKTANQYNFAGLLKTKFKGQGLEFDNIRDYSYGMEVRNIDWNVTARTGKVHIREFVTEKENNLDIIMDVTLQVTVEVGRARMTIQDLLQLGQGSVMELEKLAGEPLDVYVNGKCVARGEAVIVNEKFGVKLSVKLVI